MSKRSTKPFHDLGFAKVDLTRRERQGFPEVIFGPGKTPAQLVAIAQVLYQHEGFVFVSRATKAQARALKKVFPQAKWHQTAEILTVGRLGGSKFLGSVSVLCAGTSDLRVAEEATLTAEIFGLQVQRIYDVGVAGVHRLLAHTEVMRQSRVSIVVAGMEGALPSVVAGLVQHPVIAVPTSVGYGANLGGVAALLGMLNSCGSGVVVVNIDNGFGAAFAAAQMLRAAS